MHARIFTAALIGLEAQIVEVEVDIQKGLFKLNIVGLPDKAVQESKERVYAAIKNSKAEFVFKKITVNLAPANLPKSGPTYDFPIAVGILLASNQISFDFKKTIVIGELSLKGKLRKMNGILSITDSAKKEGFETIFLPKENANEGSLVDKIEVFPVKTLNQFIRHTADQNSIQVTTNRTNKKTQASDCDYDLKDVKGQEQAKRALEIAAAGGHNVLFSGTPGSGKTLLAKTFPSILPQMTIEESLEVTRIYSSVGLTSSKNPLIKNRPFRSPHHTTSDVALVGGGRFPHPGEISLAHRGILFLDEFPEFSASSLEALRQPLEDKVVTISRAMGTLQFPANFTLIAAMNPCKCGWRGDPDRECTCTLNEYQKYQKKISGPILDRIDLQVYVPKVKYNKLLNTESSETSNMVRNRVQTARSIQIDRYIEQNVLCNSKLMQKDLKKFIILNKESRKIIKKAMEKFNLSARSYFKILKVSRTIADLEKCKDILTKHVAEALTYRFQSSAQ